MSTLINTIKQHHKNFSHVPVGPIGSLIKLKDYRWATAVEQLAKKSFLFSFVAHNHVDAALLKRMVKDIYRQGPTPQVIVSPFQDTVYDVSRNVRGWGGWEGEGVHVWA